MALQVATDQWTFETDVAVVGSGGCGLVAAIAAAQGGAAWNIYDERLHQLGLSFEDYRQAVQAGAVIRAGTLAELARTLKLPHAGLSQTQTLAHYHGCAAGEQADSSGRRDCRILQAPITASKLREHLFTPGVFCVLTFTVAYYAQMEPCA